MNVRSGIPYHKEVRSCGCAVLVCMHATAMAVNAFCATSPWSSYIHTYIHGGVQKVMQHIYFLGPILLGKNNILRAAAFKCPAFMNLVARFPAR
jgi:hypothetical protein